MVIHSEGDKDGQADRHKTHPEDTNNGRTVP